MGHKQTIKSINQNNINAINNLKTSIGFIIAAFAFLLYAQSISFDYAIDDEAVITQNNITKRGFESFNEILTSDYLKGYEKDLRAPQYRPFTMLIFATEWQLFPNNPNIYHLINIILFSLTCWLLFLLLCKLFKNQNLIFPFVCSLLYSAHPIHTEVVDNIKSLDEILCFLFGLLSIFLFIRHEEKKSKYDLILGSLCYFISLMSKESGISFLIITPLLFFVFTEFDFKKIVRTTVILVSISGVFFLIRYKVLDSLSSSVFEFNLAKSEFNAPDVITQKATSCFILLKYLLLLIIPYPLSYDYTFAQIPFHKFTDISTILAIAIYLALGIYSLIYVRKRSVLSFGILFYLVTLFPVSNIILLIAVPMAERFMYTPSLGFCIALTYLLIIVTKTEIKTSKYTSVSSMISVHTLFFTFVFIVVGFYSIITLTRTPDWENSITMTSHDVLISNNSARVHMSYGNTFLSILLPKEQNQEKQRQILDSAISEFTKVTKIYPIYPEAYACLGISYYNKGDYLNAIKNYEIAKRQSKKPDAIIFDNLSYCYAVTKQLDKALANVDTAIIIDPKLINAYFNKGYILMQMGRLKEAVPEIQKILVIDPQNINAYNNLGSLYKDLGDSLKAKEYFEKANRMSGRQQR